MESKMEKKKRLRKKDFKRPDLCEQLEADKHETTRELPREKKKRRRDDDDEYVESKESIKILKQAKGQLAEFVQENGSEGTHKTVMLGGLSSEEDSDENDDIEDHDDDECDDFVIDEELEKKFEKFSSVKFADDVAEIISNKRTEICSEMSDVASVRSELSEDLVKLFKGTGHTLAAYRGGTVPKPLKYIPKCHNWKELLELTEPEKWTAAAIFAATRLFVSNLKEKQAGRFMNIVLLPRIRDDIREFKKLNDHLYEALIKCMFKSHGFMNGFLLPLCKSDCTKQEARIVAGVISKSTIKMEHSALAMMEIAKMPYSHANCKFLEVLIDKKYALPFMVVDELVNYFLRFLPSNQEVHVIWHQCLLTFAQRYKQDLSSEQKDALLELLRVHRHSEISPEIRRELINAKCRDIEMTEPAVLSSDQTMICSSTYADEG